MFGWWWRCLSSSVIRVQYTWDHQKITHLFWGQVGQVFIFGEIHKNKLNKQSAPENLVDINLKWLVDDFAIRLEIRAE